MVPTPSTESLVAPPPPPRDVPRQVIWRILFSDGWTIAALVFSLLGFVFGVLRSLVYPSLGWGYSSWVQGYPSWCGGIRWPTER